MDSKTSQCLSNCDVWVGGSEHYQEKLSPFLICRLHSTNSPLSARHTSELSTIPRALEAVQIVVIIVAMEVMRMKMIMQAPLSSPQLSTVGDNQACHKYVPCRSNSDQKTKTRLFTWQSYHLDMRRGPIANPSSPV